MSKYCQYSPSALHNTTTMAGILCCLYLTGTEIGQHAQLLLVHAGMVIPTSQLWQQGVKKAPVPHGAPTIVSTVDGPHTLSSK